MRLALISDIHGNDVAFEAVVADLDRLEPDVVVSLGDVAQGGAEPAQTLERLRALGARTVMGNSDAFLLAVPVDSPEPLTERQLEVREWTLGQLDAWERRDADLVAGGHPHTELTRRIGDALFVSPGSVGLVYDRHVPDADLRLAPAAEYALVFVDELGLSVELRRVPYSLARLREAVRESGRPYADEFAAEWGELP